MTFNTRPWDALEKKMLAMALAANRTQHELRIFFGDRSPYAIGIAVQNHDRKMRLEARKQEQSQ